ncbi:MAG: ABC transporter permease subunit [Clostridium sp.]
MNMFKFEFRRLFRSAMVWSLVCGGLIVMFLAFFPSMQNSGMQDLMGAKLDALPSSVLEAFNIQSTTDFTKISDYLAYSVQYIGMAAGIYGAILGVSALIKEESEGTIEFLYAKPVTRSKIVTSKLLACLAIFCVFIVVTSSITMIIATIVKPEDVQLTKVIMDTKLIFSGIGFMGLIFMSLGFLISVFIKSAKQATSIAIGVFFTTYVIGILGKMKESLKGLLYLSPSDYVTPGNILNNGFETKYMVCGVLIIIISIATTYLVYNKKDLA